MKRFQSGDSSLSAAWLNRVERAVTKLESLRVLHPLQKHESDRTLELSLLRRKPFSRVTAGGGAVVQFRITNPDFPDTVLAELWDGTAATGAAVHVAKPWDLRTSPALLADNQAADRTILFGIVYAADPASGGLERNQSRLATLGSIIERQLTIKRYVALAVINAVGVAAESQKGDARCTAAVWLDTNITGRHFAKRRFT